MRGNLGLVCVISHLSNVSFVNLRPDSSDKGVGRLSQIKKKKRKGKPKELGCGSYSLNILGVLLYWVL